LGLVDQGVQAGDELAVSLGLADPAAFGVLGMGFGVDALGGEHRQGAGVGVEAGAMLADVGVGAGALGGQVKFVVSISREHLRRILRTEGVSWQTTTTGKASNDPDFRAKMQRILALYDYAPQDGRVVCVDEFGPLNLMPRKGKSWWPQGSPARLRATYDRTGGVMHMLAALDLATGKILYRIRKRKRWRELLSFLKTLRARWPGESLYVIVDNFSPHKHPNVREWATANDVDLVFLPTYSSWLNWIESEFAALRYFALNGTDHRTHTEQNAAIAGYIRWRNQRCGPKTGFATDSPIRTWTNSPAKAA
jgi:transposase